MIQKTFALGIEDIVKPLAPKARKFGVNLGELFEKYDTDGSGTIFFEEFGICFQNLVLALARYQD